MDEKKTIYINQSGHTALGWGDTKEAALEHAKKCGFEIEYDEIKGEHEHKIDGDCYWGECPEGEEE